MKQIILLDNISGTQIKAGLYISDTTSTIYFEWQNHLFSLDKNYLRNPGATLDHARQEQLPHGQIMGLMTMGETCLAVLFTNQEHVLYAMHEKGEWQKVGNININSAINASCVSPDGKWLFFTETQPHDIGALYGWNRERGVVEVATLVDASPIYSLACLEDNILALVGGRKCRLLQARTTANWQGATLDAFSERILPFMGFKLIPMQNKILFSLDGQSQLLDENGNVVWQDAKGHDTGFQIAASAMLEGVGNYSLLGSWRRDAEHPAACLYVTKELNTIYKFADHAANLNGLKWTGYQLTQISSHPQNEVFIPCNGGGLMRASMREDENYEDAAVIKDLPDLLLLGRFNLASPQSKENAAPLLPDAPTLEKIWHYQNWHPSWNFKQKTRVYLTFDVEQHMPGKPYCITGADLKPACGIYWIMDELEKYGFKGAFFVNIYEFENHEKGFMEQLLRDIHTRGHEVGLHCHQSYHKNTRLDFNKQPLAKMSYKEQYKTLAYGRDYIRDAIGTAPVSFRSGGYSINNDTFRVLDELGFAIDSSIFIAQRDQQPDLEYMTKNKPARIGHMLEMPVTTHCQDNALSKIDINWLGSAENMINAVNVCRNAGLDDIVAMAHSFSFLRFTNVKTEAINDFKFTSDRYIKNVNIQLRKEFSKFLQWLANSSDFDVKLLKDANVNDINPHGRDLIPYHVKERKDSLKCPICGFCGQFKRYRNRQNAQCPNCGSLERMRLKNLYLKKIKRVQTFPELSILHIGPHLLTGSWLKSLPNVDYISSDPYNPAEFNFPLEKIPFKDNYFDLIICIAVLMHMLDDDEAIKEMWRVLKPGGEMLLWLGFLSQRETVELYDRNDFPKMRAHDFSMPENIFNGKTQVKEGQILYNPRNATRRYGLDILTRLEKHGFIVRRFFAADIVSQPLGYGISDNDCLISCIKTI